MSRKFQGEGTMENKAEQKQIFFTIRNIILVIVVLLGTVAGRLAIRSVMNLLLGGTMFGGDFLYLPIISGTEADLISE